VEDAQAGGEGRWLEAVPQSRVVDCTGRDNFLSAEYRWAGDLYLQDFGPQHVRRRGELGNVLASFLDRDSSAAEYGDFSSPMVLLSANEGATGEVASGKFSANEDEGRHASK